MYFYSNSESAFVVIFNYQYNGYTITCDNDEVFILHLLKSIFKGELGGYFQYHKHKPLHCCLLLFHEAVELFWSISLHSTE